ncbi:uncharacterized protein LOC135210075 [Macrobrachium nipponense]|uniref:uncharacterized protein LOC135210075 n=1 Tax=Macrobrachium nipponense TaxID=159736 RepID=UPI0030C7DF60
MTRTGIYTLATHLCCIRSFQSFNEQDLSLCVRSSSDGSLQVQLAIALGLLAVVSVYAHPGHPGENCTDDTTECKCHKLMKPPRNATEGTDGGPMGKAIKTCEEKFKVTVPTPPAGAPRFPPRLEGMTQEFKDCVRDNFFTNLGVMKDGAIDVVAMQAKFTEKINANKKADTTDAQVQKIVAAIPDCIKNNGGESALKPRDFKACTEKACVAALTA